MRPWATSVWDLNLLATRVWGLNLLATVLVSEAFSTVSSIQIPDEYQSEKGGEYVSFYMIMNTNPNSEGWVSVYVCFSSVNCCYRMTSLTYRLSVVGQLDLRSSEIMKCVCPFLDYVTWLHRHEWCSTSTAVSWYISTHLVWLINS